MTVAVILKHKGARVETVHPTATIQQVCDLLAMKRIGAAVVIGHAGEVVGLVSERDVVNAISEHGVKALTQGVDTIMTRKVVSCRLTDTSEGLMELMTRERFRHVPVVEGGRLIGIISIGDVVKRRIEDSELERHAMKEYIAHAG